MSLCSQVVFAEDDDGYAYHVCGIVHNSAKYMPDLLDYMAEKHSSLIVKAGVIGHIGRNSDLETYTMEKYKDEVSDGYMLFLPSLCLSPYVSYSFDSSLFHPFHCLAYSFKNLIQTMILVCKIS